MDRDQSVIRIGTTSTICAVALGLLAAGCGEAPGEETVAAALSGQSPAAFVSAPFNYLSIDQSGPNTAVNPDGFVESGSTPNQIILPGGGLEVGFQDISGNFGAYGNVVTGITNGAMQANTSPSIAVISGGALAFGFHGVNGHLWVSSGGLTNGLDTNGAMASGTSPSIAQTPNGNIAIAFQGSNKHLWLGATPTSGMDSGGVMATGTSPVIAAQPSNNNVAFAFQGTNGHLWFGNNGLKSGFDTLQVMLAGSNPGITVGSDGTAYVVFQSSGRQVCVYKYTSQRVGSVTQYSTWGQSRFPSIGFTPTGHLQISFYGTNGDFWIMLDGTAEDQGYAMDPSQSV